MIDFSLAKGVAQAARLTLIDRELKKLRQEILQTYRDRGKVHLEAAGIHLETIIGSKNPEIKIELAIGSLTSAFLTLRQLLDKKRGYWLWERQAIEKVDRLRLCFLCLQIIIMIRVLHDTVGHKPDNIIETWRKRYNYIVKDILTTHEVVKYVEFNQSAGETLYYVDPQNIEDPKVGEFEKANREFFNLDRRHYEIATEVETFAYDEYYDEYRYYHTFKLNESGNEHNEKCIRTLLKLLDDPYQKYPPEPES